MTAIVVLGAGGYLGGYLCRFFHAMADCRVIAVSRRRPAHRAYTEQLIADVFAERWADRIPAVEPLVVINCAFDFSLVGNPDHATRYAGLAENIAALAARGNTRLINISSMSAYPACRSAYGREKLFLEALFARHGGINVRPGLIMSWRAPGAAFLSLVNSVRNWPIIPVPAARRGGFFLCDVEVLALGLYLLAKLRLNKSHVLSFCYAERLSLVALLRQIERRYDVSRPKIAVPWRVPHLLLIAAEAVLGKAKVRADSIVDFAYPATTAPRRGFFARLTGAFRDELQTLTRVGDSDGALCLLEPGSANRRPCTEPPISADDALRALRAFADPQGVGQHRHRVVAAGD